MIFNAFIFLLPMKKVSILGAVIAEGLGSNARENLIKSMYAVIKNNLPDNRTVMLSFVCFLHIINSFL